MRARGRGRGEDEGEEGENDAADRQLAGRTGGWARAAPGIHGCTSYTSLKPPDHSSAWVRSTVNAGQQPLNEAEAEEVDDDDDDDVGTMSMDEKERGAKEPTSCGATGGSGGAAGGGTAGDGAAGGTADARTKHSCPSSSEACEMVEV